VEERKRKRMTNENIKKGQEILRQDWKKLEEQELTCISYMDTKTHEIHDLVFLGYYFLDIDNGDACDRFDIDLEDMTIDLYDDKCCIYRGNIMSIYHVAPQDLFGLGKEEEVWNRHAEEEKKEEDDIDEGRKLFHEFIAKYNIDVYEFIDLLDKIGSLKEKENE
jgi:hypothetical protein